MKKIISWIVVLIFILLLSTFLFISGKKHKVLLVNGKKGQEVPKKVSYIIDNKNKPKIIKANKKGVTYIKGKNHKIIIIFKNSNEKKVEITKKFKAKLSSDIIINFYNIINENDNWIEYKNNK